MAPQHENSQGIQRCHCFPKTNVYALLQCYRRLTTPKVQAWLVEIEREAQVDHMHVKRDVLEEEEELWKPDFSTPHTKQLCHLYYYDAYWHTIFFVGKAFQVCVNMKKEIKRHLDNLNTIIPLNSFLVQVHCISLTHKTSNCHC